VAKGRRFWEMWRFTRQNVGRLKGYRLMFTVLEYLGNEDTFRDRKTIGKLNDFLLAMNGTINQTAITCVKSTQVNDWPHQNDPQTSGAVKRRTFVS
jgi:hypothetical protein